MESRRGDRRRSWRSRVVPGALALLLIACSGGPRQAAPPTSTAGPVLVATPLPTASPEPSRPAPTPISPPTMAASTPQAQGQTAYVTNTGAQGLTLRRTPGGAAMAGLPDGTALTSTGEEQSVEGRLWRKVRDPQGREGWVAADFLTAEPPGSPPATPVPAASPVPGPTSPPPPSATPTWPVPLIPTATLRPPAPTRTPRESPAPAGVPTSGPAAVPTIPPILAPATRPATVTPARR